MAVDDRRDTDVAHAEEDAGLRGRVARHERLVEQMLRELYGLHGENGIRTEIKMLRADHESQRIEVRTAVNDVEEKMERVAIQVERIGDKQMPRWITATFLGVLLLCAVVIAGLTLVNTLRTGL